MIDVNFIAVTMKTVATDVDMKYLKNKEAKKFPSTYTASLNSVDSMQNQIKTTA